MRKEDLTYVSAWRGSSGGKPRAKAQQEKMAVVPAFAGGLSKAKGKPEEKLLQ